jgi:DNA primase
MLDDLKDEVDIEELLGEIGARKIRRQGQRVWSCCPLPEHQDKNPSFTYKAEKRTFKCYSCSYSGDVFDLIQRVYGKSFKEAFNWVKEFAGWKATITDDKLTKILEKRVLEAKTTEIEEIRWPFSYSDDFNEASDEIVKYVIKRNWDWQHLYDNRVGFCTRGYFKNRIIFPIIQDDKLVSFAARTVDPNVPVGIKYLYPLGAQIGDLLWGLHVRLEGIPIFVEGIPDALRLREYGFNAYSILGNQLGENKIKMMLKYFKRGQKIILIPDNDKGGNTLLAWFQRMIHDYDIHIGLIDSGKDVDELGRQDIEEIIKNVISLSQYQVEYYLNTPDLPSMVNQVIR